MSLPDEIDPHPEIMHVMYAFPTLTIKNSELASRLGRANALRRYQHEKQSIPHDHQVLSPYICPYSACESSFPDCDAWWDHQCINHERTDADECPFCENVPASSQESYKTHLAAHFHYVAQLSLPVENQGAAMEQVGNASMLGGYPQVSLPDLRGSAAFYAKLQRLYPPACASPSLPMIAADCGAGIGRITASFLSKIADIIDIIEVVPAFAQQAARQTLARPDARIGHVIPLNLRDWTPQRDRYDLIWAQWSTLYLGDDELVTFLTRCRDNIKKPDGWIVVKENIIMEPKLTDGAGDGDVKDKSDGSVTRTEAKMDTIFLRAGLQCMQRETQRGFPKSLGLFPVRSYALRTA